MTSDLDPLTQVPQFLDQANSSTNKLQCPQSLSNASLQSKDIFLASFPILANRTKSIHY